MPGAAYVIQLYMQLYTYMYVYIYIYMECPQLDSCLKSINDAYIYIHISIYYMLNSGFLRPQKMDGSPFR